MIELAFMLPLILILVLGVIDFGLGTSEAKQVALSSKAGARFAASQSAQVDSGSPLILPCNPSIDLATTSCQAIVGGGFSTAITDTVGYMAKWAACDSLRKAGLDLSHYDVFVDIENASVPLEPAAYDSSVSSGTVGQTVRVETRRSPSAPDFCFICIEGFFRSGNQSSLIASSSTFALEGTCA